MAGQRLPGRRPCLSATDRGFRQFVGELLKSSLITIRTVEQMMTEQQSGGPQDHAEGILPEIAWQIAQDYIDRHDFETLDAPLFHQHIASRGI